MLIEHGAGLTAQNNINDGVTRLLYSTSDIDSINFGLGVTTKIRRIARMAQMSIPKTIIN